MTGMHEPGPEFRSRLEQEIVRALREPAVTHALPPRNARRRRASSEGWRRAALIVFALALGGVAGAAPAQMQDAREREQLVTALRADIELAEMRLRLAREIYEQARRRYEAGAIGRATLASAEEDLRATEAALARLQLDLEEVRTTARPPRDELSAPPVGSRDFVRERLALELEAAQHRMARAERQLDDVRQRLRVGATTRQAELEAEIDVARARAELVRLAQRSELREAFLEKDLNAEDVERRRQQTELTLAADLANKMHELARVRLESLKKLHAIGEVEALEVTRAELEVLETAIELQRAARELEMFRSRGRDDEPDRR